MDIFISYSSKDIELVKKICETLKQKYFSYWVAHENDNFGDHYAATIISQINEAKIFLVFVSKVSNLSTHVINEINSADQGIVFTQYQIAENYYNGRGCKQDIIKAKQMWLLSSDKGFEKSAFALEKYYDIYYLDENKSFLA